MLKEGKKEQILEAGKDVLLKKGIFKTRVEDITNYLGIAKGSFYTYFKSKDQLLEEIIDRVYEIRENELEELLESNYNYREQIKIFIIKRFVISSDNLNSHLILINLTRNLEHLTPVLREKLLKIEILNRKFLKAIIKNIPCINYTEDEMNTIIIFIMGGIKSYRLERLFYKNTDDYFISDIEEFRERLRNINLEKEVELVVNGILKLLTGGN
ncbi:MAG: TetR/AcrR family transcriptional regulator [Cetobacterium sp.]|uniref:TetR/AcrR family transcriptional regulator n=2 Tax=Fusobacteriaceae TaxID=203492 RepID=UPI001F053136|nr:MULTISPECIES: TetR/AcrR family transcriptional regulator [Cetobacterium]MCX3067351.1 TetR/AcrR family transcriptional regulator [Cetobacterium somerae]UPO97747.1 TetR/AcrR family transcriptional regulator [Cetobacterium somerae]